MAHGKTPQLRGQRLCHVCVELERAKIFAC
jgi:hypothetical protein